MFLQLSKAFIQCILYFKKTEVAIFQHKNKKLEFSIKIKLSRKRLYPSKSVKYFWSWNCWEPELERSNWSYNTDLATELNRANALLSEIRNCVNFNTLKAIYFAIFDLHMNYANPIWEAKPQFKVKSYYFTEKKLSELIISSKIVTQVHYSNKVIFLNFQIKF